MANRTVYIIRKTEVDGAISIFCICETLTTAKRIMDNRSGYDIVPWNSVLQDGFWTAPFREILATDDDKRKDLQAAARQEALDKALAAGLTLQDLMALGVSF